MNRIYRTILTINAVLITICSTAQQKEQKKLFNEFMMLCNAYKTMPLYLNLGYKVSSNLPAGKEDTTMVTGDFYLAPGQAYIRFGQMEQVLNDSLAAVVMNDIKHIVLHKNNQPLTEQLNAMAGKPLSGESLKNLMEQFYITKTMSDNTTAVFRLQSKSTVYENMDALTTIEYTCNTVLAVPQKAVTVKRALFRVTGSATAFPGVKYLEVPGKGKFGIKETITTFLYNKVEHKPAMKMPVIINDRVFITAGKTAAPASGYEDYYVSEN